MNFLSFWRHNRNLVSKFKYPISLWVLAQEIVLESFLKRMSTTLKLSKSCVQFFSTIVLYLQYESSRKSFFKFISLLRSYLVHYSKAFKVLFVPSIQPQSTIKGMENKIWSDFGLQRTVFEICTSKLVLTFWVRTISFLKIWSWT